MLLSRHQLQMGRPQSCRRATRDLMCQLLQLLGGQHHSRPLWQNQTVGKDGSHGRHLCHCRRSHRRRSQLRQRRHLQRHQRQHRSWRRPRRCRHCNQRRLRRTVTTRLTAAFQPARRTGGHWGRSADTAVLQQLLCVCPASWCNEYRIACRQILSVRVTLGYIGHGFRSVL